jgi:hypothetical protein
VLGWVAKMQFSIESSTFISPQDLHDLRLVPELWALWDIIHNHPKALLASPGHDKQFVYLRRPEKRDMVICCQLLLAQYAEKTVKFGGDLFMDSLDPLLDGFPLKGKA